MGSHKLEVGSEAPAITLSTNENLNLEYGQKYTIINFWSAFSPSSRLANHKLSNIAEKDSSIACLSVCIDTDPSISKEIIEIDGISGKVTHLDLEDISYEVLEDYQTESGCRMFLIDQYGILKAIADSSEDISTILS